MPPKLPDPYPSPPGRPGKYCLYVTRHRDDDTQCMVVVFCEPFAVRKFLDELLEDDGFVWEDTWYEQPWPETTTLKRGSTIRSETGIVVSTRWYPKRMRECVEHEYSLAEMAFDLSPNYVAWAKQFRNGPELPRTLEEDGAAERVRERREKKSSGPSVPHPAGSLHVKDIAMQMSIDARDARRALRSVMSKPAYGWWFKPDEVDAIKKKITAAMED